MIELKKRLKAALATTAAVATIFTVAVPAGNAYAADRERPALVPCANSDQFLKLTIHRLNDSNKHSYCFANRGHYNGWFGAPAGDYWLDEIRTGNNNVTIYDGRKDAATFFAAGVHRKFPNRPLNIDSFYIW